MASGAVELDPAQPVLGTAVATDGLGVLDEASSQVRGEQRPSRQEAVGADRLLGAGHEVVHRRVGELASVLLDLLELDEQRPGDAELVRRPRSLTGRILAMLRSIMMLF